MAELSKGGRSIGETISLAMTRSSASPSETISSGSRFMLARILDKAQSTLSKVDKDSFLSVL